VAVVDAALFQPTATADVAAAGAQVFTTPQANFRSVAVVVAQEETRRRTEAHSQVGKIRWVATALKGGLDHQHSRVQ
jgi:hypothetical protein